MTGTAVIVVPTQGEDVNAFQSVAKKLNHQIYGNKAIVVKTTVSESGGSLTVTFKKSGGGVFTWDTVNDLSSVLTISHAFSCDGPNLAYHGGGYQPWGSEGQLCQKLSAESISFWGSVGKALKADGKIILLGCFMGSGIYAEGVAKAAGRTVYASTSLFGAGNAQTALSYVREIESGTVTAPMKEFTP